MESDRQNVGVQTKCRSWQAFRTTNNIKIHWVAYGMEAVLLGDMVHHWRDRWCFMWTSLWRSKSHIGSDERWLKLHRLVLADSNSHNMEWLPSSLPETFWEAWLAWSGHTVLSPASKRTNSLPPLVGRRVRSFISRSDGWGTGRPRKMCTCRVSTLHVMEKNKCRVSRNEKAERDSSLDHDHTRPVHRKDPVRVWMLQLGSPSSNAKPFS